MQPTAHYSVTYTVLTCNIGLTNNESLLTQNVNSGLMKMSGKFVTVPDSRAPDGFVINLSQVNARFDMIISKIFQCKTFETKHTLL